MSITETAQHTSTNTNKQDKYEMKTKQTQEYLNS